MKCLVVSGGGSWGAFTVGRMLAKKIDYDVAIGCSTGSLMAPFALLGKYDLLKDAYSDVDNSNIFSVNPFDSKGNLKILNAIFRIAIGKRTLGENKSLKDTILKYFTIDIYKEILATDKQLYVTVCNLNKQPQSTEYISIRDCDYETFCDYILASCSVPLVASIITINGNEYSDGGTLEGVPLSFVVNKGYKDIDVYLHEVYMKFEQSTPVKNILHFMGRLFKLMRNEMRKDDLRKDFNDNVSINLKYLPSEPNGHILVFNKDKMKQWIEDGYNYELKMLNDSVKNN